MSGAEVKGWVYLVVHDRHDPADFHVKIGFTERDPVERAREFVSTGANGTFVVIYQAYVSRPQKVEHAVHRRLASCRRGGEWFEVCPDRAKEEIVRASGGVHYEETTPRWHPSQPAPREWTKTVLSEARRAAEERARRERAAEEERKREQERRDEQTRRQAEQMRQQKEQADREARRRAEDDRIREAKAAEQKRKHDELKAHERRARRAAQAAANAEWCRRTAKRLRVIATRASLVIAPIFAAAVLVYATAGPFPESLISQRRRLRAEAVAQAATLEDERERSHEDYRQAVRKLESLLETKPQLDREQRAADALTARADLELRYAEKRLIDLHRSPPRVSPRALREQEQVLDKAVADREQKHRRAVAVSTEIHNRLASLPLQVRQAEQQLIEMRRAANEMENRIAQQTQVVLATQRDLAEAIQRNARWYRWFGKKSK